MTRPVEHTSEAASAAKQGARQPRGGNWEQRDRTCKDGRAAGQGSRAGQGRAGQGTRETDR